MKGRGTHVHHHRRAPVRGGGPPETKESACYPDTPFQTCGLRDGVGTGRAGNAKAEDPAPANTTAVLATSHSAKVPTAAPDRPSFVSSSLGSGKCRGILFLFGRRRKWREGQGVGRPTGDQRAPKSQVHPIQWSPGR